MCPGYLSMPSFQGAGVVRFCGVTSLCVVTAPTYRYNSNFKYFDHEMWNSESTRWVRTSCIFGNCMQFSSSLWAWKCGKNFAGVFLKDLSHGYVGDSVASLADYMILAMTGVLSWEFNERDQMWKKRRNNAKSRCLEKRDVWYLHYDPQQVVLTL